MAESDPAPLGQSFFLMNPEIDARLAGIPLEAGAIAGLKRLYGRKMPDFDYYLAIAALKHAVNLHPPLR